MPGFRNEKIPEAPTQRLTAQIVTEAEETIDAFIFKTILPFCQEVTQRAISKKDLEQALIHYFPKERIKTKSGCFTCPTCYTYITSKQAACDHCGQRLEVEHENLPDMPGNETF